MRVYSSCPRCGQELTWIDRGGLVIPPHVTNRPRACVHCKKKLTARMWAKQRRARRCEHLAKQAGMPLDEWRQMRRREAEWAVSRFNPWRKSLYHPFGGPRG